MQDESKIATLELFDEYIPLDTRRPWYQLNPPQVHRTRRKGKGPARGRVQALVEKASRRKR